MYNKGFYLEGEFGNNAFSFNERKNKKLYIPELIEIDDFGDIELQDDENKIAFEDFGFDGKISTNLGLKNFYKIKWKDKNLYFFDNHNHAFYFWYEARKKGIIGDNNILFHVDEHADTRDNGKELSKDDSKNLDKVFEFTNRVLNVGDYIVPAKKEGIIGEVIQIRNQTNLEDYLDTPILNSFPLQEKEAISEIINGDVILNLDLDFFQKDLDFIDYELKKKVILDLADKAKIITVASSPFFINQNRAIEVFMDIFEQKI